MYDSNFLFSANSFDGDLSELEIPGEDDATRIRKWINNLPYNLASCLSINTSTAKYVKKAFNSTKTIRPRGVLVYFSLFYIG